MGALGPQGSQRAGFRAAGAVGPEGEAVPHLVKLTGTAEGACGVWEQPQPRERGPQGRSRGQVRAPPSWGVTLPGLSPPRGGKCWARGCVGCQGRPAWAQALLLFTSWQEWAFGDARGGPSTGTWLHEDGSMESSGKAPNTEQERGSRGRAGLCLLGCEMMSFQNLLCVMPTLGSAAQAPVEVGGFLPERGGRGARARWPSGMSQGRQ